MGLILRSVAGCFLWVLALCSVPLLAQQEPLGHINFPNSGAAAAQPPFLRGVLLLHNFEYDDAAAAFREAQQADKDFALAYWGEAMTYNHPLWFQQDRPAALAVLARLAPTAEERLAKAPTEREKSFLNAVEILYGNGSKEERDFAYAEAMRRMYEQFPDDAEAACFYALALLGTCHQGRDFATYMKAAGIVEEVFARQPQHPGAAHYLIHSYDDPIHAPLGLRPARVYAKIAKAAPHAQHMPSHIFLALGMWDEVAASNEDSWASSEAQVQRHHLPIEKRGYHALSWLHYAYLQQGRYADARRLLDQMTADHLKSGSGRTRWHLAMMQAAYLVETGRWPEIDRGFDPAGAGVTAVSSTYYVEGLSALATDSLAAAQEIAASLADWIQTESPQWEQGERQTAEIILAELQGMVLWAAGTTDSALALLSAAASQEDALPFDFGPPVPVKPVHELLGEIYLKAGQPQAALEHFQKSLNRAPGRAHALLGLAEAAHATGKDQLSQQTYEQLDKVWHRADPAVRRILEEARAAETAGQ